MRIESYAVLARRDEPDPDRHLPLVQRACRCRGFVVCNTCLTWDALIRRVEHRHKAMAGGRP